MANLYFHESASVLRDLMAKFKCNSLRSLQQKLKGAGSQDKEELFYGALFAIGVSYVQKRPYYIKLSDSEPWDIEMIDVETQKQNQQLPKERRKIDHWKIQNVQITEYYVNEGIKHGENDIYKIFTSFLEKKKLSPKKDYKGGLLVFHFALNVREYFSIHTLRECIRAIQQNSFEQIWITTFAKADYSEGNIAELLMSDSKLLKFPVQI